MNQLLMHLIGDYLLQSSWQALNKEKMWQAALSHVCFYMIPFMWLPIFLPSLFDQPSWLALAIIGGTHYTIDRYAVVKTLATRVGKLDNEFCPESIKTWIPIIWDNTAHLCINFLAIGLL